MERAINLRHTIPYLHRLNGFSYFLNPFLHRFSAFLHCPNPFLHRFSAFLHCPNPFLDLKVRRMETNLYSVRSRCIYSGSTIS